MADNPLAQLKASMSRNDYIVLCYRAGNTITEIADVFNVTKQAIYKVLKKAGLSRKDNPRTRNRDLYAFVGANLEQHVKDALIKEAKRQHMSISAYVAKLIKNDLMVD